MTKRTSFTRRLAPLSSTFVGLLAALLLAPTAVGLGGSSAFSSVRESGPGIANHPVGVVPSEAVTVPSDWPLDDKGAITCLTCHMEIPPGPQGSGPHLRDFESTAARPIEFCAKCHSRPDQRNAGSVHWLALGVAHM